ncbi:uncharacterized protein LOC100679422 [Nasonia vitripennis]|uniref:Uncharacterized protein n=1 Tax=Nasonia vitripennis TaxID=7425 RepID=A0A7M7GDD3_NASVI|nr:uncharacterized protein LOC100679422 [Nasonia vitripennis]
MASKNNKSKLDTSIDDWTLEMIDEFIKTLMDITLCNDVKELKNYTIPEYVWKKIEKLLNTNSESLKKLWYFKLHLQLFCPQPIYLIDTKIKMVEYVYQKGITKTRDINWHNLTLSFDGMTKLFLNRVLNNLLQVARIKTESVEFEDQIIYLYTEYLPHLIEQPEDKILPRLTYDDNKLVHFEIDVQKRMSYIEKLNAVYEDHDQ